MRVLILSDLWAPFPGGAERLAFNLGRDLMQRGHQVQVLTGYELAQEFDGPPVRIHDDIGVFDNRDQGAAYVEAFIGNWAPDVIISHHLYAYQFEKELRESGVPLVHIVLNGQRIEHATFAVFISKWIRERGNARDYDLTITPPVFPDIVAERHGNAIGFIKPIHHKGVHLVYEVADMLPDKEFVILRGEWQDLEIIEEKPNVRFMEPVIDMRDFYGEINMVLMPSISEDAGTVAQEAALNGIPCLSSNVDGLYETNAGGVRLERDDPLSFVAWIVALDHLPELRHTVVQRQTEHLKNLNQDYLLDMFAAGVYAAGNRDPLPWVEIEEEEVPDGEVEVSVLD